MPRIQAVPGLTEPVRVVVVPVLMVYFGGREGGGVSNLDDVVHAWRLFLRKSPTYRGNGVIDNHILEQEGACDTGA